MTLIIRPKLIKIGKSEATNDHYEWYGIKSINWSDVTPWVHTDIPSGPMIHHHLRSPHIVGELRTPDLAALYAAIFTTPIDASGHTAVHPNTNIKYTISFFAVDIITEEGGIIQVIFDGLKIETVGVENIELGEPAVWVVKFTADLLYYVFE